MAGLRQQSPHLFSPKERVTSQGPVFRHGATWGEGQWEYAQPLFSDKDAKSSIGRDYSECAPCDVKVPKPEGMQGPGHLGGKPFAGPLPAALGGPQQPLWFVPTPTPERNVFGFLGPLPSTPPTWDY